MFYHLIVSTNCNSCCRYCIEEAFNESILEKDDKIKDEKIDYELPEQPTYSIDKLKDFISKDPDPTITFYGGEPLMDIDFIKQVMDEIDVRYMIQTNGKLLDKLPKEYIERFHTILVSLDGNKETTDYNRGDGTYDLVMKNLTEIRKYFKGEMVARMTIDKQDVFESVKYLHEEALFDSIHWQLNANFWGHDYERRNIKEFLEKYNQQITKLNHYWLEKLKQGKVVKLYPFLGILNSILDNKSELLRCGSGHENFTILPNGKIGPCPIMVAMKYYCGDLEKGVTNKMFVDEECQKCEDYDLCGGRCLYANISKKWPPKYKEMVCDSVRHLIKEMKDTAIVVKNLIKEETIKRKDLEIIKYNGAEIIP